MSRPLRFATAFFAALPLVAAAAGDRVDFNYDVRPIISAKCYHCHGPDEGSREADLRLDQREVAVAERDGVRAVIPGDPDKSELILRITSTDRDEVMPPPKEGHALTAPEVDILKRWIAQGAEYKEHWAWSKPVRPPVPAVAAGVARNPIDAFILDRLRPAGLEPAPEADRHTLIRRLSLDLIGLPPTPEEVQAFVSNDSPGAYEAAVDRLLASPHFGEKWARMWLDLARYADSTGYGSDKFRLNIWPYRDWVISAFNRNLPYDQFTTEQIAGDLLPGATQEQIVATAFHRNTMTNVEGGTIDEEYRVAAVKDRVATTFQTWMGLTAQCAQCHTHKFDPISHKEYYQAYAVFNQTEDSDREDEEPKLPLPTPEDAARRTSLEGEVRDLEQRIAKAAPEQETEQHAWEAEMARPISWTILQPVEMSAEDGTTLTLREDGSIFAQGGESKATAYVLEVPAAPSGITALRLEALPDDALPSRGPGRAGNGNAVLSEISVAVKGATVRTVKLRSASADFSQKDWGVEAAIDGKADEKGGWAFSPEAGKPHTAIFETREPLVPAGERLVITLTQRYGQDHSLGRFRLSVTDTPPPVRQLPEGIAAILALEPSERSDAQRARLAEYHRPFSKTLGDLDKKLSQKRKELAAIKPTALPILRELPAGSRRETRILSKGNYLTPADPVTPGLPAAFLGGFRHEGDVDRLALARWLVSPENPLTARVAVNRVWSQLFGTGIVETEEDFGTQGTLPSHPELLDWLAVTFQSSASSDPLQPGLAWDFKALLKTIVTSATYRQSSKVLPAHLEKDARNQLLARYPRRRLEAEAVRDQALAFSGLLAPRIGGPSVYPQQPDGLWMVAFNGGQNGYPTSKGEDRYRRGLYTFWRRTQPYPSMATFDAPSRESCTVRRIPTNTPLQAFVTLNDPCFVEAAQALARRVVREGGSDADTRLRWAVELVLARKCDETQIAALRELLHAELAHYTSDAAAAASLAGTEAKDPSTHAELAAWTVVANVLLNLDGVLMKG